VSTGPHCRHLVIDLGGGGLQTTSNHSLTNRNTMVQNHRCFIFPYFCPTFCCKHEILAINKMRGIFLLAHMLLKTGIFLVPV
jgi:hypothetical protein